jgi:hypothetical protein
MPLIWCYLPSIQVGGISFFVSPLLVEPPVGFGFGGKWQSVFSAAGPLRDIVLRVQNLLQNPLTKKQY